MCRITSNSFVGIESRRLRYDLLLLACLFRVCGHLTIEGAMVDLRLWPVDVIGCRGEEREMLCCRAGSPLMFGVCLKRRCASLDPRHAAADVGFLIDASELAAVLVVNRICHRDVQWM